MFKKTMFATYRSIVAVMLVCVLLPVGVCVPRAIAEDMDNATVQACQESLAAAYSALDALETDISALSGELSAYQAIAAEAEKAAADYEAEMASANATIAALQEVLTAKNAELAACQAIMQELEQEVATYTDELSSVNDSITSYNAALDAAFAEIAALMAELAEAEQKISELERENSDLAAQSEQATIHNEPPATDDMPDETSNDTDEHADQEASGHATGDSDPSPDDELPISDAATAALQQTLAAPTDYHGTIHYDQWSASSHKGAFTDPSGRTFSGVGMYGNIMSSNKQGYAYVRYDIPSGATGFSVSIGLDALWCSTEKYGISTFSILIDDAVCYTKTYTSTAEALPVTIPTNADSRTLTLRVDQDWRGGMQGNHACYWGNPQFLFGDGVPALTAQIFPRDWQGEYDGSSGIQVVRRNISIHIDDIMDDGTLYGRANISPSDKAGAQLGVFGSYKFKGAIDFQNATFLFQGYEWIDVPIDNFSFLHFSTSIDLFGRSLDGVSSYGIIHLEPAQTDTQTWLIPILSVDIGTENGLFAHASGGTGATVSITSNQTWALAVTQGEDWIALSCESGKGDGSFHTHIAENTGAERVGYIELSAEGCETIRIKVTQEGTAQEENAITLTASAHAPLPGNEVTFRVAAPGAQKARLCIHDEISGTQLSYEADITGNEAAFAYTFHQYGGKTVYAEAYADGGWTRRTDEQTIDVQYAEPLDMPALITPAQDGAQYAAGADIRFHWQGVAGAARYIGGIYDAGNALVFAIDTSADYVTWTASAQAGEYQFALYAVGKDRSQSAGMVRRFVVSDTAAGMTTPTSPTDDAHPAPVLAVPTTDVILDVKAAFTVHADGAKAYHGYLSQEGQEETYIGKWLAAPSDTEIALTFQALGTFTLAFRAEYPDGVRSAPSAATVTVRSGLQAPDKPKVTADRIKALAGEAIRFTVEAMPGSRILFYVDGSFVDAFDMASDQQVFSRAFSKGYERKVTFTCAIYDVESEPSNPITVYITETKTLAIYTENADGTRNKRAVPGAFIGEDAHLYAPLIDVVSAIGGKSEVRGKYIKIIIPSAQGGNLSAEFRSENLTADNGETLTLLNKNGDDAGYVWVNATASGSVMVTADQLLGYAGYATEEPFKYSRASLSYILNTNSGSWTPLQSLMEVVTLENNNYVYMDDFCRFADGKQRVPGQYTIQTYGGAQWACSTEVFADPGSQRLSADKDAEALIYTVDMASLEPYSRVRFRLGDNKRILARVEDVASAYGYGIYTSRGQETKDIVTGDIRYINSFELEHMETILTIKDVTFRNDYFKDFVSTTYNHDIAKFALAATCASNTPQIEDTTKASQYTRGNYIMSFYKQFGFDNIKLHNFDKSMMTEDDTIAFSLATRKVADGKTLVCLVCRGSGYGSEWVSNANVGKEGDHEAFWRAANNAAAVTKQYLETQGLNAWNSIILITGFSRSAAVGNYVGHLLNESAFSNQGKNICAYVFATPNNTVSAPTAKDNNLFNILNPNDLVTLVPFEKWGFTRFGREISLPAYDCPGYKKLLQAYEDYLEAFTGLCIDDMYEPADFGNSFLDFFGHFNDVDYTVPDTITDAELMELQYNGVCRCTEYVEALIKSDAPLANARETFWGRWQVPIQSSIRTFMMNSASKPERGVLYFHLITDKLFSASSSSVAIAIANSANWEKEDTRDLITYLHNIMTYLTGNHRQETYISWMYSMDGDILINLNN